MTSWVRLGTIGAGDGGNSVGLATLPWSVLVKAIQRKN